MVLNEATVSEFNTEFFSTDLASYAGVSLCNLYKVERRMRGQGEDSTAHFEENSIFKLYFMGSTIYLIKSC